MPSCWVSSEKPFSSHPIIGGLAVFKAHDPGGVGEGEEQVVLVVVVILIERVGFTDEIR